MLNLHDSLESRRSKLAKTSHRTTLTILFPTNVATHSFNSPRLHSPWIWICLNYCASYHQHVQQKGTWQKQQQLFTSQTLVLSLYIMDVRWQTENDSTPLSKSQSILCLLANKCTLGCKPFHFLPKMLWPITIVQLCTVKSHCCGAYLFFVRMSLVGKETSCQRIWRHFPGTATKDLHQGKHINVCEVSLGIVQNTMSSHHIIKL